MEISRRNRLELHNITELTRYMHVHRNYQTCYHKDKSAALFRHQEMRNRPIKINNKAANKYNQESLDLRELILVAELLASVTEESWV
jgi:phosphoenolpyruvate carboxylase